MLSDSTNSAAGRQPIPRRLMLAAGGGALLVGGVAAAALARGPRRADGLPASVDFTAARAIGDGFYIVDGWVLTTEDLEALKSAPRGGRP